MSTTKQIITAEDIDAWERDTNFGCSNESLAEYLNSLFASRSTPAPVLPTGTPKELRDLQEPKQTALADVEPEWEEFMGLEGNQRGWRKQKGDEVIPIGGTDWEPVSKAMYGQAFGSCKYRRPRQAPSAPEVASAAEVQEGVQPPTTQEGESSYSCFNQLGCPTRGACAFANQCLTRPPQPEPQSKDADDGEWDKLIAGKDVWQSGDQYLRNEQWLPVYGLIIGQTLTGTLQGRRRKASSNAPAPIGGGSIFGPPNVPELEPISQPQGERASSALPEPTSAASDSLPHASQSTSNKRDTGSPVVETPSTQAVEIARLNRVNAGLTVENIRLSATVKRLEEERDAANASRSAHADNCVAAIKQLETQSDKDRAEIADLKSRWNREVCGMQAEIERLTKERDEAVHERECVHQCWDQILVLCGRDPKGGYPGIVGSVEQLKMERDHAEARYQKALAELSHLQWVDLKERMPTKDSDTDNRGEVIVYDKNHGCNVVAWPNVNQEEHSHWMPIPNLPPSNRWSGDAAFDEWAKPRGYDLTHGPVFGYTDPKTQAMHAAFHAGLAARERRAS